MSYELALGKACDEVIAFEYFGSYQGEWYAVVRYNDKIILTGGSYGSCSGCDAYEAEFGWSWNDETTESEENERLRQFGLSYLSDDGINIDEEMKDAEDDLKWDMDSKEKLDTLRKWKEKYFTHHEEKN